MLMPFGVRKIHRKIKYKPLDANEFINKEI